jgi:hypothetical protein
MAGKRGGNDSSSSKKAAGQARKAETANNKKAAAAAVEADQDAKKWDQGSKDSSRAEAAAAKKAEAARKKAEREELEAKELAELKSAKPAKAKAAGKKGGASSVAPKRGLDLGQLDATEEKKVSALNATGIDNALDALSLAGEASASEQLDRHPERRVKAAYTVFELRRLEEMKDDKTLRRQQKIELIRKEFEKSPENPFNQVSGTYNATRDELQAIKDSERTKIETRLTGQN